MLRFLKINLSLPSSYLIMKPRSESQTRHVASALPLAGFTLVKDEMYCVEVEQNMLTNQGQLQDLKHILIVFPHFLIKLSKLSHFRQG